MTVEMGTNLLVGQDMDALLREAESVLDGRSGKGRIPPLWEGRASERIADVLEKYFS